mmetsp:Transcript_30888/g.95375  ORF Transcript_30888/g.95375 Transcript_30888/m.95375 type:complete len:210 (-) Transcript_30888:18-647(-)
MAVDDINSSWHWRHAAVHHVAAPQHSTSKRRRRKYVSFDDEKHMLGFRNNLIEVMNLSTITHVGHRRTNLIPRTKQVLNNVRREVSSTANNENHGSVVAGSCVTRPVNTVDEIVERLLGPVGWCVCRRHAVGCVRIRITLGVEIERAPTENFRQRARLGLLRSTVLVEKIFARSEHMLACNKPWHGVVMVVERQTTPRKNSQQAHLHSQ